MLRGRDDNFATVTLRFSQSGYLNPAALLFGAIDIGSKLGLPESPHLPVPLHAKKQECPIIDQVERLHWDASHRSSPDRNPRPANR